MSELLELGFVRDALAASLLIGLMLSLLGIFVVLRRIVFVGAALAQVSAAGVALAIFAAEALGIEFLHDHPESMALAATLAGAALLSVRPRKVNLPSEGVIGVGYAVASTLAILLIARSPGGEGDSLLLFYGNILAVTPKELRELLFLCPVVLAAVSLFYKEFLLVSFNPDSARASGVRVGLWNLLLYALLGLAIAFGIRAAGALLTFSYLVLPGLAGVLVARKTWHVPALAIAIAVVGSVAGILLSVRWDLPSGPMIVAALVAELGVLWLVARSTA